MEISGFKPTFLNSIDVGDALPEFVRHRLGSRG